MSENEKMVTYEFREYNPNGFNVDLEFTESYETMNCARFHDFCKRFAIAVGYMPSTVENIFGETRYEQFL